MIENIHKIVDHFGFKLMNSYRGRGAYICETDDGVKLLKEMEATVNRTWFEYYVKKHLIENGFNGVDQFNTVDKKPYLEENDKKYILKDWCDGRECNLFVQEDILEAVQNLAELHKTLQFVNFPEHSLVYSNLGDLPSTLKRHANELKKIRKFIRSQSHWSEFEIMFLKNYGYYFEHAKESINGIENTEYYGLVKEAKLKRRVCHGQYTQHNVLTSQKGLFTVNFEKSCFDLQIMDLHQFIRKVMEKNNWSDKLGMRIIETYDKTYTLNNKRLNLLYYLLMYPEKFWKISNYYFNSRKTWKSNRNIEKLEMVIEQQKNKDVFLDLLKDQLSL